MSTGSMSELTKRYVGPLERIVKNLYSTGPQGGLRFEVMTQALLMIKELDQLANRRIEANDAEYYRRVRQEANEIVPIPEPRGDVDLPA